MANVALTEPIAVPPEHVFAFFVPQRMPYWYGAEMDSQFEVLGCAAEFAVGSKVSISGRVAGKIVAQNAVVTAFEYARLLEWRFEDAHGVRGRERWQLDRVAGPAGGGTVVTFTSDYILPGTIGRVVDYLVTRHAVARRSREYLQRLARLAEHRA
jgi:uncharacterized protein YndB with AHSA1/START domain